MKNTVNIFEELNKMKNLIHVKRGTVISEQETDLDKDVEEFRSELFALSTDEQKLVDILKKYATDKNTFKSFENKYYEKNGVKPTDVSNMATTLDYSNDVAEINDLNSALSKIGLRYTNSGGIAKFEELSAVRQRNINANYCRVKDDKIVFPGSAYNGSLWSSYVSGNKVTPEEIAAAKATCPQVVVPDVAAPASDVAPPASDGKVPAETLKPTGPTPTQRLAATAKSLGVENPQMDVATLQKILDTLNASSGAVTESKKSVNEELNTMKYLLGYQRGKVISEQDAVTQSTATPKDLITQIQTVLKTKYNANLGNYGPNKDGIDGKWGNISQTALETALKTSAETKQKADELSQRRAAETQQTATQDAAIQQAVDKGSQNIMNANLQVQAANTPGVKLPDLYTTLVNNKTLVTRPNGNIVYKGVDLTSTQRQELETKLKTMGYNLSTDNRDKTYGDKLVFKKNQ
jgi:hypothetical protein